MILPWLVLVAREYNHDEEPDGLQEEYETAFYAIGGKPQWEGYEGGKKYQPTDFIELYG
jgi:hypothetical protein